MTTWKSWAAICSNHSSQRQKNGTRLSKGLQEVRIRTQRASETVHLSLPSSKADSPRSRDAKSTNHKGRDWSIRLPENCKLCYPKIQLGQQKASHNGRIYLPDISNKGLTSNINKECIPISKKKGRIPNLKKKILRKHIQKWSTYTWKGHHH